MKKVLSLIITIFLLSINLSLALPQERLHVSKLRFIDEYTKVGEELVAVVNLENDDLSHMDKLKITVLIYDLALRKRIGPFDLRKNKEATKRVYIDVPGNTQPGFYTARITISNDDIRRVKHRWVYVGPKIVFA